MAAPSYATSAGAIAVSTTTFPSYPASPQSGDLHILFVSSDATGIGTAPAPWVELTSGAFTAGGLSMRVWWRLSTGTESGTVTVNVTSGTKGVAWIAPYRPAVVGDVLRASLFSAGDTDTTSTAFSATSASTTTATDNRIVACVAALAPSAGTYTATPTGRTISQTGATLVNTGRFGSRTGTNTISYMLDDASVTTGATAGLTYAATTVGANAAGIAALVVVSATTGIRSRSIGKRR